MNIINLISRFCRDNFKKFRKKNNNFKEIKEIKAVLKKNWFFVIFVSTSLSITPVLYGVGSNIMPIAASFGCGVWIDSK